jgi:hypothetical protein
LAKAFVFIFQCNKTSLFDHLVSAAKQRERQRQTEHLGRSLSGNSP